ncbi:MULTISPECIES: response regulator transcription factor [unclassified Actinotalea]|uniref:response regulator transcription factor n=1 Tax=unclassified Actinotalea TaxID=2638618 RepID=UPI001C70DA29|nr:MULTISPECIES: response regulator transcription factor [unclassified Actinotalea]
MIRVLLVEDDPLVRTLLQTILEQQDLAVVGQAADGDEVVAAVQAHHPDVVLMDLRMARMSGVEATAALQRLPEPPAVIALTSFDAQDVVLAAVHAGARGYLAKDSAPEQIADAVRVVAAGGSRLSDRASRAVVDHVTADVGARRRSEALARLGALTDREQEIATAAAAGLSNAAIAARTFCSEATVKTHLNRAMTKLGLENRVQLATLVDRAGLTPG